MSKCKNITIGQSSLNKVTYGTPGVQIGELLEKEKEDKDICPICKGSGEVQQTDIDWDDCRRCNGTGYVEKTVEIIQPKKGCRADDYFKFFHCSEHDNCEECRAYR